MQGTMKAGRLHQLGEPVHVEEVPIPEIGPGEVLVRILRAGLNRGDLHMRNRQIRVHPGEETQHLPVLPITIGHDGMGEVVEVSSDVRNYKAGDRVIIKCTLTCGYCKYCRSEREHLCINHRIMGFVTLAAHDIFMRYKDGLWAEYCRVPVSNLEKLEPGDDIDKFSLLSQMAVGFRALKRARVETGETIIVNAATGITGLGVVISAMAMGAAHIIAIARDETRLASLKKFDPKRISTISAKTESIRQRVMELTGGNGASVLVDVTPGGIETTIDCLYSLERGGRVSFIGNNPQDLQIPYLFLMLRSIEFTSCHGRNYRDVHYLVELARHGILDLSPIRPKFFKVEQVNEALDWIEKRKSGDLPVWPMMRAD